MGKQEGNRLRRRWVAPGAGWAGTGGELSY